MAHVVAHPGCTTSEVQDTLTGNNSLKTTPVSKAVELGHVRRDDDPNDKRRKLLFPIEPSDDGLSM